MRKFGRRREPGSVLLEGPRVVSEAVACGVRLELLAVREGEPFEAPARVLAQIPGEREVTAIRGIGMDAKAMAIAKREDLVERIDRTDRRGAHGRNLRQAGVTA